MATQQRIGRTATKMSRESDGTVKLVYHWTTVVTVKPNGDVILDHNSWRTATTKTRMNQLSNQLGLGYTVYQKDGDWFVSFKGRDIPFNNTPLVLKRGRSK
jgi:hypothetical protein